MKVSTLILILGAFTALVFSCRSTDRVDIDSDEQLREAGLEITNAAFSALSGRLMEAIREKGVAGAIDYCHVHAYPIVDSIGLNFEVDIKRVSLLNRNPTNFPDAIESDLITDFTEEASGWPQGDTLLTLQDGSRLYARPILLQPACLKCHGTVGTDIAFDDYDVIKQKYPNDKAIGYVAGDFRGLWIVRFQ